MDLVHWLLHAVGTFLYKVILEHIELLVCTDSESHVWERANNSSWDSCLICDFVIVKFLLWMVVVLLFNSYATRSGKGEIFLLKIYVIRVAKGRIFLENIGEVKIRSRSVEQPTTGRWRKTKSFYCF